MAFKEVQDLGCDTAVQLGGINKKTGKPNPKSVEGYLVGARDIDSKFSKTGKAKLWIFQTSTGNVGVYGKTDLDSKLNSATPGAMTRVTQTHSVPTNKGNDMLKFKVEIDAENMIDVSNVSAGSSENYDDSSDYRTTSEDEPEESDVDSDAALPDEQPAPRAAAPRQAAKAPSADSQRRVQELLAGRRPRTV